MATVKCTRCLTPVKPHCPRNDCGWMRCTNTACDVRMFDVYRGLLQFDDLRVIGWAEDGADG